MGGLYFRHWFKKKCVIKFIAMTTHNALTEGRLAGLCLCCCFPPETVFSLCAFPFKLFRFPKESDNHPAKVFFLLFQFSAYIRWSFCWLLLKKYCWEEKLGKACHHIIFFSIHHHKATQMVLYCFILTVLIVSYFEFGEV